MAFGPNTSGLVPLTGPYGTFQVPAGIAPAFGLPDPLGPPPTFAPGELEGAILGDVPGVAGSEPLVSSGLPQIAPPPPDVTGPAPLPAPAPVALPPSVRPAAAPQSFVSPDEQAALDANAGPGPQPRNPRQSAAAQPAMTADQARMDALDQREAAAREEATVRALAGDARADALDASNAEIERMEKMRGAERERAQKEISADRAKVQSAVDAYSNHKVDQNRLWHSMGTGSKVMAAIGIALSGLGGAFVARDTGRPVTNPALDMLMGALQDDVRLQLADRDKLAATVGMKRDALGELRQNYSDDEAAYKGIVAAHLGRVERQVQAIEARTAAPLAKAELQKFGAEIQDQRGRLMQESLDRETAARQTALENKHRASQLGLGWANYKRGVFEDERDAAEDKRRFDLQLDAQNKAALASAKAKGGEESLKQYREDLKDVEQRGINDPTTGETMLQPEGKAMVERAAKLEAAADKNPAPAVAEALRNEATALRGEARIKHALKGRTPEKSGDISQAYAGAVTAHGLLSDIKDWRNKSGWESDTAKSEALQAMKSRYAASKAITGKALQLGSMDEGTNTMLDELFGGDPTQWRGTEGSIDAAIAMLEQRTGNMLRAEGLRGAEGFRFPRSTEPAKTAADEAVKSIKSEKTTAELEKSLGPSGVARSLYYPFGGSEESSRAKRDSEAALAEASYTVPGASKKQGEEFDRLINLATTGDSTESAKARASLVALAVGPRKELRTPALASMAEAGMTAELKRAISGISDKKERAFAESYWLPRAEAASNPVSTADLVRGVGSLGR